jgi:hypothetical protein
MDEQATTDTGGTRYNYAGVLRYWNPSLSPEEPADTTILLINMDGSIWCDWAGMEAYAAQPTPADINSVGMLVLVRALLAHNPGQPSHLMAPSIPVVSRAQAEAIAVEYGRTNDQPKAAA